MTSAQTPGIVGFSENFTKPPPFTNLVLKILLSSYFKYLENYFTPTTTTVMDDIGKGYIPKVISMLSNWNIPDMLFEKEMSVNDLANAIGANDKLNLMRVMRAAETFGYFKENVKSGTWKNTRKSELLISHHPNSLKMFGKYFSEFMEPGFSALDKAVIDDKITPHDFVFGHTVWDLFAKNPEKEKLFA